MNARSDLVALGFALVVGLAALSGCAGAPSTSTPGAVGDGLVVATAAGKVRGLAKDSGEAFLGLPFAMLPGDSLRWAPPEAPRPWQGVRDASVAGPSCPQVSTSPTIGRTENEDCLYLNLYRPAGAKAGAALPVPVYVHGGANLNGGAVQIDGARMAAQNGIVVVSVNHRLGALGFLNHPGIAREASSGLGGNYGLLDIVAALEWVQRNAAAFGGNHGKVTLGGTSSGGTNVCALIVNPVTRGLVQAAILSSDDCLRDVDTLAESHARAEALAVKLGCVDAAVVAACLRSKSVKQILEVAGMWNPHIDPDGLHRKPAIDSIAAGEWQPIPILMGSMRDEGRSSGAAFTKFSAQDYQAWVARLVGPDRARTLLAAYPPDRYSGQYAIPYVIGDFVTDSGMRGLGGCTNLALAGHFARQSPTFYYQFEDPNPPYASPPNAPPLPGYEYRASHGLDTPYTWPDSPHMQLSSSKFTPAQRQLSDQMTRYWAAFAKNFDPAVPGQAAWPRLMSGGSMLSLRSTGISQATPVAEFAQQHKCALWESMPWILNRG
jgi:para-nitrobenzyl esterase